MPTYSIRINTSTGTYHIFNSLNANNDRDTSYCGNVDYDETEVVEVWLKTKASVKAVELLLILNSDKQKIL